MSPESALEEFYAQLSFEGEHTLNLDDYKGVVLCGVGGSGIVGDIARSWLEHRGFDKPVLSYRGYGLPKFVDEQFLVICVSYSGNTEETIGNLLTAVERGIKPVCVSSGGKLEGIARERGFPFLKLPEGFAPRFALGFMLSRVLSLLGIDSYELDDARENLEENLEEIKSEAEYIADRLYGYIPVIYSTPLTEAVALRWKAEINENAETPCYTAVIPEMHHNEIVGLGNPLTRGKLTFLIMVDVKDTDRIRLRAEITKQILRDYGVNPIVLSSEGNSYISRLLRLIHLGDWTSLYLSKLYGCDPMPVRAIDHIKERLSTL